MRCLLLFALTLTLTFTACAPEPAPVETETTESTTMAELPDITLQGNRFAPLTWDEMTDAQKTMTTNILAGPRTAMGGPFNVLLRSPEMGDMAQALGAYARFNSSLPGKLREMSIIMAARFWMAQFEWNAHKRAALAEGLDPAIVDAIATGQRPANMDADETVIYDFVDEMLNDKRVSDESFAAAIDSLGERGVVDVIGTVGYYSMVSLLLNVDEYPLGEGVEPELQPLD
jgi:4-carboxymuconolactone decarboxylase